VNDGANVGGATRPKLFEPFTIRGLTLKNRLVVPPMVHYRAEPGGTCGTFHVVHLGRYALGGFGLVFVEATGVEEIGLINEHDLGIWNETQAESFKPLIAFMRRENTAIGIQLAHGGSKSSSDKAKDQACSAVSDIKTQVNDLKSLTVSTDSVDQAQKDLQAIQDDLKTIQQQAPNVKGDLQTQLKDANQAFEQSVSTTLQSLQSGSLGSVASGLTEALTTLENSYQQAFSGVKC